MKVLFVYTEVGIAPQFKFLLEIGVYAAVLKKAGFDCAMLYLTGRKSKPDIVKQVEKIMPETVVFFSTQEQFSYVREVSRTIKDAFPNTYHIIAGLAPTLLPDEAMIPISFNAACLGECETALLEFLSALKAKEDILSIRNFRVRLPNEKINVQPLRPLEPNLDTMPMADRDIFNHDLLLNIFDKKLFVNAGKGSLENHTFTTDNALRYIYSDKGTYRRVRSAGNIIEEILAYKGKIKSVCFLDSNFIYSKEWLLEFLKEYEYAVGLPFSISAALSSIDSEIIEALRKANCKSVALALETGNSNLRFALIQSNVPNDEIIKLADEIRKNKMALYINIVIGFPKETSEHITETIGLLKKIKPEHIFYRVYYPIPETSVYKYSRDKGMISRRSFLSLATGESVLDLSEITQEDLRNAYESLHLLDNVNRLKRWNFSDIGRYNFAARFADAKIKGAEKQSAGIMEYVICGEKRMIISQRNNSDIRYKITPKKHDILMFGILVEPWAYLVSNLSQIAFKIEIFSVGAVKEYFSKTIEPHKKKIKGLYWKEYALSLDEYEGREIKIIFKIICEPDNLEGVARSGWIEPMLLSKRSDADYIEKRMLLISVRDKEEIERKAADLEKKVEHLKEMLQKKESECQEKNLEIENRIKRVGELNSKIMELDSQMEEMQQKIDELLALRDEYEKSLSGKMKKMLRGKET